MLDLLFCKLRLSAVVNKRDTHSWLWSALWSLVWKWFVLVSLQWFENNIRELKQPRRRQQQGGHEFACLSMKNSSFARFALVFLNCKNFADVKDVSIWYQMFNFVFLPLKRWFQFNSTVTVETYFARAVTLNNWEMIAETRCYIFRWRSCCRRRRYRLSSVMLQNTRPLICIWVDTPRSSENTASRMQ